ncbi:hypothetical protein L1987_41356 [Smallanthus sonchifolius]|uniref:Uncharacterized protein n=1 Tax=Smallanthus sonchifolius TaxID=185202 RepID=A0ACB9GVP1_9ASTR|nr:hypothetical protein L1987_41356 [Smallanthus sonchifolius]
MTVVPDNGRGQGERENLRKRDYETERTGEPPSPATTKDGCGGSRWQRRLGSRGVSWSSRWVVFHGAIGSVNPDLVSSDSDLFTSTSSGARSLVEGWFSRKTWRHGVPLGVWWCDLAVMEFSG